MQRDIDFRLVDNLMDPGTEPPPFTREAPPPPPADAKIAPDVPMLHDSDPFPSPAPLPQRAPSISILVARSACHTRTNEEVLSALAPFFDRVQREANLPATAVLCERAADIGTALRDGRQQMAVSDVFDYLLVRERLAGFRGKGVIPLLWARRPCESSAGATSSAPGERILLVVARDAPYRAPGDLKGKRLAVTARYGNAPGVFLAEVLIAADHPLDQPFFSSVTLRRYAKDAVLDVLKGRADVACVDEGTVAALDDFYGIGTRVRTLAGSPRYDLSVLYTSENNMATHRPEIEQIRDRITALGTDAEGQELLFLFDTASWHGYREGDFAVAREHYLNFQRFLEETPADLRGLLDPQAAIDARTYDRYGDE
ncbi:MAG TPA: PhnD/SsuA/transferrin family substrate-binding protein [Phycisphaerae bacterium]|nr:PhnD/SsuA/transferrin family substrate-binding protein [Phycisphaerae bacterium]